MNKIGVKKYDSEAFSAIAVFIPKVIIAETEAVCRARGLPLSSVNEIRLRAMGLCSIVLNGKNTVLKSRVSAEELREILKRTCDMAVFAHRDDIANGFVPLPGGGRVGVCGHAKYDGGRLVGVSSVTSLVFRVPGGTCDFADKLFNFWQRRGFCGMLICSRAGVGKTSAIRALAARAGDGIRAKRVVVVDERCEFDPYAYRAHTVDILRGYSRAKGIEIAVRTMSAEILIVDEIGSEADCQALMLAAGAGIPVIATAHGDDARRVLAKPTVKRLYDNLLFDAYAVILDRGSVRELVLGDLPFADFDV